MTKQVEKRVDIVFNTIERILTNNPDMEYVTVAQLFKYLRHKGFSKSSVLQHVSSLYLDNRLDRVIVGAYRLPEDEVVVEDSGVSQETTEDDILELRGTFTSSVNIQGNMIVTTTYGVYKVDVINQRDTTLIAKFDNGKYNA